jgi:hypothetical protein
MDDQDLPSDYMERLYTVVDGVKACRGDTFIP